MGDILRTIPAVRLVRRALPEARIYWLLEQKWQLLLDGHPDIDGLLPLPRKQWTAWAANPLSWPRLAASILAFRRTARSLSVDVALEFHGNLRSGLACRLSGAPVRLGYDGHQQKEGNRRLTTHRVAAGSRRTPRMERNLDLVAALGIATEPLPDGGLPMVQAGDAAATRVLGAIAPGPGGHAIVSPGASASQSYKTPPPGLLAAACRRLDQDGITPIVIWGPGEESLARKVVEVAGKAARIAPPTDLTTLAALLSRARLFVGGDSGPLHMACAVSCPVIGIYGPTDPQVNRPWGVPFRVVQPPGRQYTGIKRIDRVAGGFDGIAPDAVTSAVDELLGAGP